MPLLAEFPYKSIFDVHNGSHTSSLPSAVHVFPDDVSASKGCMRLLHEENNPSHDISSESNEANHDSLDNSPESQTTHSDTPTPR